MSTLSLDPAHGLARLNVRLHLRGLVLWGLALAALDVLYAALWPSISGNSSYADILDQMPKAYRSIIDASGGIDLTTAAGYLQAETFALTAPLLLIVQAVALGTGLTVGWERGTRLETLLAGPLGRTRWYLVQVATVVVGTAGLCAATLTVLLVVRDPFELDVPVGHLVAACVQLGALATFFGALAIAAGAATGQAGAARAVCGVVAVLGYLVNVLAPMADALEPLRPLSPFHWYARSPAVVNGLDWAGAGVLLGAAAVLVAAGAIVLERRDLHS
ncbi:ABC transporter permease subunit [Spongisporangium articulatum]|uniref:ABC transporter permease subunit n=1 Tax=Spongisporangium articulatum TaxID=3362603 RepID=A0ABW8AN62_9ACTN